MDGSLAATDGIPVATDGSVDATDGSAAATDGSPVTTDGSVVMAGSRRYYNRGLGLATTERQLYSSGRQTAELRAY